MTKPLCVSCQEDEVIKFGFKKTTTGKHQQYKCTNCRHIFTLQTKYKRLTDEEKSQAVKLSSMGQGVRQIAYFLDRSDHSGIYSYLKKN